MVNDASRSKVIARLHRIAGQVEGIGRMVESDRYYVDVLLQVTSAQVALNQVRKLILRSHVETCVAEVMGNGKAAHRRHKLDELMEVFARHGGLGR